MSISILHASPSRFRLDLRRGAVFAWNGQTRSVVFRLSQSNVNVNVADALATPGDVRHPPVTEVVPLYVSSTTDPFNCDSEPPVAIPSEVSVAVLSWARTVFVASSTVV